MDITDLALIRQLQEAADLPLAELAKRVNLSKTACWNRLRRLEEADIIQGKIIKLNRVALGLPITVFLSITVGRHAPDWVARFATIIDKMPEIVEAHRLTGEGADYQLKVICPTIEAYDAFQQRLIGQIDFTSMSTKVALQELKQSHFLPL